MVEKIDLKSKKQQKGTPQRPTFLKVLRKSSLSFLGMAPLLLGVIGLVGLFQALVTPKMLASVAMLSLIP